MREPEPEEDQRLVVVLNVNPTITTEAVVINEDNEAVLSVTVEDPGTRDTFCPQTCLMR